MEKSITVLRFANDFVILNEKEQDLEVIESNGHNTKK